MKKHSFIESTLIATLSIILIKVLGIVYVIPFYAIVGAQGAALYAYAYNIYGLFLEIATAGIPTAIGKLVNEYRTLGMEEAKVRTYKLGRNLLLGIAILAFIIMFIFAKPIATLILGDLTGGNTIGDVTFVIRCVSFSILLFPFLSVTRGFFQGHKLVYITSFSQVIEQLARVIFIVGGSYIALKILHLDLTHVVGVAVFSAFVGGAFALIYVFTKMYKNKNELALDKKFKDKNNISNKEIYKKIFKYAIPTVIISIAFNIYNNVDMILILRTINNMGFNAFDVEFISTAISTWATKISLIITSIGLGLSASLMPTIVEAYTLKNFKEVNNKFNKSIELILFITIPMCVGISLLSSSIWTVFYGNSELGSSILSMCIYAPLFSNLYMITNYTLQSMNRFKIVYISAISGIVLNTILDVPLMYLCKYINIPAYFGAIFATIIGYSLTIVIAMIILKKDYNFNYKSILKTLKNILLPTIIMIIVVILLKQVIRINLINRYNCVIYISIISIIGAFIYFFISYKIGLLNDLLGNDFLLKIKNKIKLKK